MKTLKSSFHIPRFRILVQAGFTVLCLYGGYRFYHFHQWALGQTDVYTPRPPSVEGFLPISAFLGLKRFVLTGFYDDIHPAGLTIFLAALTIAFFLRKGFCGWICPVGFVSNLVEKVSRKMTLVLKLPRWIDYPLLTVKYLLLVFFCYIILWQMDIRAIEAFIRSPYNKIVDGKMLLFFLAPSRLTLQILAGLFLLSLIFRNFWCRYLCPYGALLGVLAFVGLSTVRREKSRCIQCKQCDKICPGSIPVSAKEVIRSPECVGCMECVAVCPQDECLSLSVPVKYTLPVHIFPLAVLALFLLFWTVAVMTGHWHSAISPEEARQLYPLGKMFSHP